MLEMINFLQKLARVSLKKCLRFLIIVYSTCIYILTFLHCIKSTCTVTLPLVPAGSLWLSLVILSYPWLSLVILSYPWLSLVIFGYP